MRRFISRRSTIGRLRLFPAGTRRVGSLPAAFRAPSAQSRADWQNRSARSVRQARHRPKCEAGGYAAHSRIGQHRYKWQAFFRQQMQRALVFVICINEFTPSCIRAPPEAATQTNGQLSATARRIPCTKRSPTTEPIEPPISGIQTRQRRRAGRSSCLSSPPKHHLPRSACVPHSNDRIFLPSLNFKGSVGLTFPATSSLPSSSKSRFRRCRADNGLWWLHFGQT